MSRNALTAPFHRRNGRFLFILVVDCKSCEVVDVVDVRCPERMKCEAQSGILGSVNSLPYGDSVMYNFPASAEVFVYNRKDKTTQCYTLGSDFTEAYYQCQEAGDEGLSSGYVVANIR